MEFAARHAAFVAIDLQRAFCCPDGSVALQGRDVTACALAAARCLDLVAAARGAGMAVVWTRLVLRDDYADGGLMIHELRPGLKEIGGVRAGTPDVELISEARVAPEDFLIDKVRYSAFLGTPLENILRANAIDTLMVGGVTTSMCVESTVRDAGQRDFRTFVVSDACGDYSQERQRASLDAMEFGFARVLSHNEALAAIAGEERHS